MTLRQSDIKQQSMFEHWPFDQPKQGLFPSACWMVRISSVFFAFPGVIPRPLAFSLIWGIVIDFCNTFVAGIFFSFTDVFNLALCARDFLQRLRGLRANCHYYISAILM